jgi:hypothetical protein
MVYHQWGNGTHIYYTTSSDGITWAAQTTLLTVPTNQSLNYVQIIGDTGETCGQDALLVYESSPSTQDPQNRSRDMIERWIHWGTLTTPAAPINLSANGQWSCQTQVALKWNAANQTQGYNVFRSTSSGGTYTKIGGIATTASFPTYTDLSVTAGTTYYYEVQATNTAGASAYSSIVSVVASGAAVGKTISVNIVGGTTGATNTQMDCSEVAGVVAAPTWNNALGANGTLLNLKYNAGASSDASVTWSSPNTWSTGIPDTAGNYRMMKGYLDGSNPSVTISNIPTTFTNAGYDVYVYCDGDAYSGRIGKYTIGSTSIQATDSSTFNGTFVQANNSAGNYVVFSNLKTSQFTITCQGVGGGDGVLRASVNGIQIVAPALLPSPNLGWQMSVGSNSLVLTWPVQYLGWTLMAQTNSLGVGLSINWVSVTGSPLTNQVFQTINPSNSAVFYRLVSP